MKPITGRQRARALLARLEGPDPESIYLRRAKHLVAEIDRLEAEQLEQEAEWAATVPILKSLSSPAADDIRDSLARIGARLRREV